MSTFDIQDACCMCGATPSGFYNHDDLYSLKLCADCAINEAIEHGLSQIARASIGEIKLLEDGEEK